MIYIGLAILMGSLLIGVPVCLCFLLAAVYYIIAGGYELTFIVPYGISKLSNAVIFTVPLFVLAGRLMEKGNIGGTLIGLAEEAVGKTKGGLGVVATVSSAIFGSVTGSGTATLTCIGSIMFPRFAKNNYPKGHYTALMASSSVLGMLIPPSGIMIIYAWVGGQSVLASFLSTVVPGIMLTVFLSIVNCYLLRNNKDITYCDYSESKKKTKLEKFQMAFPALLMPVIILGGIYSGIMTPTEAAAVAVIYAIPVGFFIYKGLTLANFKETLIESGITTGSIMIMMFGCTVIGRMFIEEDVPGHLLELMYTISHDKQIILLMLNIFMIILGMLMDDASAVMLATPIMIPIINEIGVSPVHFAAIVAVNSGMGNITPPCAPLLYLSGGLSGTAIKETIKPCTYFILFAWIPVLTLTIYFPILSMWLPRLVLGIK